MIPVYKSPPRTFVLTDPRQAREYLSTVLVDGKRVEWVPSLAGHGPPDVHIDRATDAELVAYAGLMQLMFARKDAKARRR